MKSEGIDPIQWEIRSLPIVSSTQDYVKRFFRLETDRVIVLSKVQESGRGRNKNIWQSPDGGVWLSIGLKNKFDVVELSTPVVETVCSVLEKYVDCTIKQPNDIFVGDYKLAGILVETVMSGDKMSEIMIGIGINVNNEIPDIVKDIATRLSDHISPPSVVSLASEVSLAIIKMLTSLNFI